MCSKPVVTAIHGAALEGGLEIALASHYRLAVAGAKLGLPEVRLGVLPGAGGTQRAPRLVGVEAALGLMLSGEHIDAREALRLGLVDRGGEGHVLVEGLGFAQELITAGAPVRRTRNADGLAAREAATAAIESARTDANKKSRGRVSPLKIVDAVEAAIKLPFEEGLRFERARFLECVGSPQRAALVHAFQAEREVQKAPETRSTRPRPLASIGVMGGGTMGAGIAVSLLDTSYRVVMIERDAEMLARGHANVEHVYNGLIVKGRLSVDEKNSILERFTGSVAYDALADVDLVIEAAFEEMSVKRSVFAELDRVCKSGAVLATNTSYLNIDHIAASRCPETAVRFTANADGSRRLPAGHRAAFRRCVARSGSRSPQGWQWSSFA